MGGGKSEIRNPKSEIDPCPNPCPQLLLCERVPRYHRATVGLESEPEMKLRSEYEPPLAVAEWGWRYHHIGIPTDTPRPGEFYLEEYGMHVSGFETSPFGVEWMRFEPGSPVSELIRTDGGRQGRDDPPQRHAGRAP